MSTRRESEIAGFSRRQFFVVAAVGGGAVATSFAATPALASNKMPQKAVSYQPTPKGNQRCDNCAFWLEPASCKLVDGQIAPAGWCVLYKKK